MAEEIKKEYINAEDLQRMFRAATNQLLSKRDKINALNVNLFVPSVGVVNYYTLFLAYLAR